MNCRTARLAIHRRLDNELVSSEECRLIEHLRTCGVCAEAARALHTVQHGLRNLDRLGPLGDDLRTRRDGPTESRRRRLVALRPIVVAAAACVAAVCLVQPSQPWPPLAAPDGFEVASAEIPAPQVTVALRDASAEHYMAVALPSQNERVHVVWLFSRVDAKSDEAE